jgi:hypothetical protein
MITIPRIIGTFVAALLLMTGVFFWRYSDLVYLHQPIPTIEQGGRDTFTAHVDHALARTDLTRRHLDTIADVAARFGDPRLEAQALARRTEQDPANLRIQLRLADAYRRAGDLTHAERFFRDVLLATGGEPR